MPKAFESANDYPTQPQFQQPQASYFPPVPGATFSFNTPSSLPSLPPLPSFEGTSQSNPTTPADEHAPRRKSSPPSGKRPTPYERGLGPRGITLHRGEACLHCRKRKMRCDAAKPACGPCAKAGKGDDCEYEEDKFVAHIARLEAEVDRLRARNQELERSSPPASSTSASSSLTSLAVTTPTSAVRGEMPLEQPRPTLTPGVNVPSEAFGRMMSIFLPRATDALHLPPSSQMWLRMLVARGRPVPAQSEVLVEAACAVALGLYAPDSDDGVMFPGSRQGNARTFVLRAEGALARAFMFLGATDTTQLFPLSVPAYNFPSGLQLNATPAHFGGVSVAADDAAFTAHRFLLAPSPSSPVPSTPSSSSSGSPHPFSSPSASVPRKMQPGRSPLSLNVSTASSPPPAATLAAGGSLGAASGLPTAGAGTSGVPIEFLRRTLLHTIQSLCLVSTLAFAHGRALEGHKHLGSALRLAVACGLHRLVSPEGVGSTIEEWYPEARDTWFMLCNTEHAWSIVLPSLRSETSVLPGGSDSGSPGAGHDGLVASVGMASRGSPAISISPSETDASPNFVTRAHALASRATRLSYLLQTSGASDGALFHPVQATVAALEALVQAVSPDPTHARAVLILSLSALARLYDGLHAAGMLVEEHAPGGLNAARGVAAVLRSCDTVEDNNTQDALSTLEPCVGYHLAFVEGFLRARVQPVLSFGFGDEDADLRTIQDALRRLRQWMPYLTREVPHLFAN